MPAVVHPRIPPRRGGARASTWWGRAWVRAVEESSYDESDLRAGRALARSGLIGHLTVDAGRFVAAVEDPVTANGLQTVSGSLPVLDEAGRAALVECVAAGQGRVASLIAGDLPHDLVEHAEEAGVELLPYGAEFATTCSCRAWVDPCAHALGVLHQLAWLVDADPLVLFALRGVPGDELVAQVHATASITAVEHPDHLVEVDLDVAAEAAAEAVRLLGCQ